MSNARSFKPVKQDEAEEVATTLLVTMDDSQLNEILLPVLTEINLLRHRVAELEERLARLLPDSR